MDTIKNITNNLENLNNTDQDFSELIQMALLMPEEDFQEIAEPLLESFDLILHDTNNINTMKKALVDSGISSDYITTDILKEIDAIDNNSLSESKKSFLKRLLMGIAQITNSISDGRELVNVAIELINEDAKIPKYAKEGDGAADVYSTIECDIMPGETKLIPLGIKIAIPMGYGFIVQPRSGLSLRMKMRLANSPGLCDSAYRGEYGVIVENIDPPIKDISTIKDEQGKVTEIVPLYGSPIHIDKGERIAQLRLVKTPQAVFYTVKDIHEIEGDRESGFGGTGLF